MNKKKKKKNDSLLNVSDFVFGAILFLIYVFLIVSFLLYLSGCSAEGIAHFITPDSMKQNAEIADIIADKAQSEGLLAKSEDSRKLKQATDANKRYVGQASIRPKLEDADMIAEKAQNESKKKYTPFDVLGYMSQNWDLFLGGGGIIFVLLRLFIAFLSAKSSVEKKTETIALATKAVEKVKEIMPEKKEMIENVISTIVGNNKGYNKDILEAKGKI